MSEGSAGPGWWQTSDGGWYDPGRAPAGHPPSPPDGPPGPKRKRRRSNPGIMTIGPVMIPMGWYGDPWNESALRWWDGYRWTGFNWPRPGLGEPASGPPPGAELALSTIPEDFASTDRCEAVLPPELPARLHGGARSRGPWILVAFAAILLILLVAVVGGPHGSRSVNWIVAVSCLSLGCVILLAVGVYALAHLPYLEMDAEGIVVHRHGRHKRIAWTEIADVGLHVRSGEGVVSTVPTLYLRDGGTYGIQCLTEWGRSVRARQSVELLLAAKHAQVGSGGVPADRPAVSAPRSRPAAPRRRRPPPG